MPAQGVNCFSKRGNEEGTKGNPLKPSVYFTPQKGEFLFGRGKRGVAIREVHNQKMMKKRGPMEKRSL